MGRIDKAGGLWLNTDKNGKKYLSGTIEKSKVPSIGDTFHITIFRNSDKKKATHPDYVIYLDETRAKV